MIKDFIEGSVSLMEKTPKLGRKDLSMVFKTNLPVSWIKDELAKTVSYNLRETRGHLEYYDYEKQLWCYIFVQEWEDQEMIRIMLTPANKVIIDALSEIFGYKPDIKFDEFSACILEWKRPLWFKIKKILTEKTKSR